MRILATFSALLSVASLAHAGPMDDCNQVHDLNRQLRGCTAYIKQGKATPENLATAYLNRANIYSQRGKYPLAFANYAAAITLDPAIPSPPTTVVTRTSIPGSTSRPSQTTHEP